LYFHASLFVKVYIHYLCMKILCKKQNQTFISQIFKDLLRVDNPFRKSMILRFILYCQGLESCDKWITYSSNIGYPLVFDKRRFASHSISLIVLFLQPSNYLIKFMYIHKISTTWMSNIHTYMLRSNQNSGGEKRDCQQFTLNINSITPKTLQGITKYLVKSRNNVYNKNFY
jgi:hypothetical protein